MSIERLNIPLRLPVTGYATVGRFVSPGRWTHGARKLPEHVLIFVRTGMLHIREEDTQFAVGPDEFLVLQPGRLHTGTSDQAHGLSYFWMHFQLRDLTEHPDSETLCIPQHGVVTRPERLEMLFRSLMADMMQVGDYPFAQFLHICQMLCEIGMPQTISSAASPEPALMANHAAAYIRSHLAEPISTSSIAAAISCNPKYLSRVYHQVYGETPTSAIRRMRMEYAKHSLVATNMTVSEISRACGFTLPSYFIKIFRGVVGMTPGSYRALHGRTYLNNL